MTAELEQAERHALQLRFEETWLRNEWVAEDLNPRLRALGIQELGPVALPTLAELRPRPRHDDAGATPPPASASRVLVRAIGVLEATSGREVTARVVPYHVRGRVSDGGPPYDEMFRSRRLQPAPQKRAAELHAPARRDRRRRPQRHRPRRARRAARPVPMLATASGDNALELIKADALGSVAAGSHRCHHAPLTASYSASTPA